MARVTIKIDGMSCMHCVGHVKKALDGLAGVNSAEVSVGSEVVDYDGSKLTRAQIEQAITKAGYKIAA